MEMRVEQLSVRSDVSVDTIRYYQSKGLVEPPRREGRIAWYDSRHVERLARIRSLQKRGFTLATIARLVTGELDAADEVLLGELSGLHRPSSGLHHEVEHAVGPDRVHGVEPTAAEVDGSDSLTLAELAIETGVPLALLKAIEAEGLLIPRRIGGLERYTSEDVASSKAGLLLLEWGIPLSALLELARRHHEATEAVAHEAVAMFSLYVRGPLRDGPHHDTPDPLPSARPSDPDIDRLLVAYSELLPAVNALVGHHFTRTLVKAALDHVKQVGSAAEQRAVWGQIVAAETGDPDGADVDSPARVR